MATIRGTAAADRLTATEQGDLLEGLAGNDILKGGSGDDELNGGPGADFMDGGYGYDIYYVDNTGDRLAEDGSGEVRVTLPSYQLPLYLEQLTGLSVSGQKLTGNYSDNVIRGNVGNDRIDGGHGVDRLIGSGGNDSYVVDEHGDFIVEVEGEGIDQVLVETTSFYLPANVENAVAIAGYNTQLYGNGLSNELRGTDGWDNLDGRGGADTLIGGKGNDWYFVDSADDVIVELLAASEGKSDTVVTGLARYELQPGLELAIGTAATQTLIGNDGDNWFEAKGGGDTLIGGRGDDLYDVGAREIIVEKADEGTDSVRTKLASYTLGGNLENLQGTNFWTGQKLTGNGYNNEIIGSFQNDVLDGAAGVDYLIGGHGSDIYHVDEERDLIEEIQRYDANFDEARVTAATYRLGIEVDVEILTGLLATGQTLIGNEISNTINGGTGADLIDGGGAADSLAGGLGSDTYVIDDAADVVTEAAQAGTADEVQTALASFMLPANVENLTGTAIEAQSLTGNELGNIIHAGAADDTLEGLAGNDVLDGGAGADSMSGGGGDDTYSVDDAGDAIIEAGAAGGVDLVRSMLAYTLASDLENLALTGTMAIGGTGNSLANVITGNVAANIIDGGAGSDRMAGGGGNDIYFMDHSGDVVIERAGGGVDRIESTVRTALRPQVEQLTLVGETNIDGIGNAGANRMIGNAGSNRLDGGAGADFLLGGAGNDTYVLDQIGDRVSETSGLHGTDVVLSFVDHALGAHVEKLTLLGTAAARGSGNSLANVITGNAASNLLAGGYGGDRLSGGGGDDLIRGGRGGDSLRGGTGRDGFVFDELLRSGEFDTIVDFTADDHIRLSAAVFTAVGDEGRLSAARFHLGAHADEEGDRILYDAASGKIFYDADGSGGGAAMLFARVTPNADLSASDFLIIG